MGAHQISIDNVPTVNPTGAPSNDKQNLDVNADQFGGGIARSLDTLGHGLQKASSEGFEVANLQEQMDAKTHAAELHSWQSDRITDLQSGFLEKRGKAALEALPGFKKDIDDVNTQARDQATNPYTKQLVDQEGRRLTDVSYAGAARHAASQRATWESNTAQQSAVSYGDSSVLAAVQSPAPKISDDLLVVDRLFKSDQEIRNFASGQGYDGPALEQQVKQNRGRNVGQIVKQITGDGSRTGLQRAIEFFHSQYDKIDPASRVTIESGLKTQSANYDGQSISDRLMGRAQNTPPGYISRTFQIESGGNVAATTGKYKGLGQFGPDAEARYGLNDANREDPNAQARALALENQDNHDALAKALGHEPTPADYYLAHQQGIGGAVAHLSNPTMPAWQSMASTMEGRSKGDGWAKQAIWGNMTPEMKAQFPGGVETVTSADFSRMWAQRFNGQKIQGSGFASNLSAAKTELKLTPQEEALYQRHVTNLTGPGGVDNADGSRSTLYQASVEHDGKTYNIPTVWDGKILSVVDSLKRVEAEGWDKFPAYANAQEAEARYQQMHAYMDKDTAQYFAAKKAAPATAESKFVGAQQFTSQNKSDVLTQIQNDPYLMDHPQAMAAAIKHANEIFQVQNASYIDQERKQKVEKEQRAQVSDQTEDTYLKDIYSPEPKASVTAIVNDTRLTREAKTRLINIAGAPGEKDNKTYGSGFEQAFRDIHSPEGTPGRITDPNQLYSRLGKNGDLTMAGVEKLRQEIDMRKSPEGTAEAEMRKQFLTNAKSQISGSDEGLHIKDPKGDDLYLKFLAQALPLYDAGRKAGKSPTALLNPDSPDYVGKVISTFKRPMDQWFSDIVHDQPAAKAAEAAFDIKSIKTVDDAVKAYRAGNITKADADQLAIEKGWGTRKAPPPAAPQKIVLPLSQ